MAGARVLRGRLPQDGRRRPLRAGDLDAARGDRRRPEPQPRLEALHAALRRRPGAARRPAHAGGRRLGHAGPLPRAGPAPVRSPTSSTSCATCRRTWPRAPGAGCSSARPTDPEGPEAPGLVVLRDDWSVESLTPGVERWLAELPDGDWESARQAAPGGAGGGRPRAADRRAPGCAGRGRVGAGALARGPLDGAPRRLARRRRRAARRGHRRARPSRPHLVPADGRLRADRARAGRHPAGAAGQLDGGDRRPAVQSRPRPSSSTSRACSTRRACAAGASSSARSSSPTTSRACATTSGASSRVDRFAAGRWIVARASSRSRLKRSTGVSRNFSAVECGPLIGCVIGMAMNDLPLALLASEDVGRAVASRQQLTHPT